MLLFATERWLKSSDAEWIQQGHQVSILRFLVFGKLIDCLRAAVADAREMSDENLSAWVYLPATPTVPLSILDRKHVIQIQDIRYFPPEELIRMASSLFLCSLPY